MRLLFIILSIGTYASCTQQTLQQLELTSISQLQTTDTLRFDLSGIAAKNGDYYVIADKEWNNFIYQIDFTDEGWRVVDQIEFSNAGELELDIEAIEAIDIWDKSFIMANEKNGKSYIKTGDQNLEEIKINFEEIGEDPSTWGNAGWEGIAIDNKNNFLYLAKERQPRFVIKANIESGEILDKFNIPETESNDFADVKYQNGFLYLLERNGNYISKVDPETHEVETKVSYKHVCSMPEGKLYLQEKYGMAEALLLLEDEIWIGIDNNGVDVSPIAREKFGMQGNAPAILKFKRPSGF